MSEAPLTFCTSLLLSSAVAELADLSLKMLMILFIVLTFSSDGWREPPPNLDKNVLAYCDKKTTFERASLMWAKQLDELRHRRRWTTGSALQSNMYGIMPFLGVWDKHNSLPLGPIQSSSPTNNELHSLGKGTVGKAIASGNQRTWVESIHRQCLGTFNYFWQ